MLAKKLLFSAKKGIQRKLRGFLCPPVPGAWRACPWSVRHRSMAIARTNRRGQRAAARSYLGARWVVKMRVDGRERIFRASLLRTLAARASTRKHGNAEGRSRTRTRSSRRRRSPHTTAKRARGLRRRRGRDSTETAHASGREGGMTALRARGQARFSRARRGAHGPRTTGGARRRRPRATTAAAASDGGGAPIAAAQRQRS